jgi:putative ABC transport system permease protein
VEAAARVILRGVAVQYEQEGLHRQFAMVDPSFFAMFDFPFVRGNAETIVQDPGSMAISERLAAQFFGDEDPLGKVLTFHDQYYGRSFVVRGILKDVPDQSTIHFDMLVTTRAPNMSREVWDVWRPTGGWGHVVNYVLLKEGADAKAVEAKLEDVIVQHMGEAIAKTSTYYLQPLTRAYLYSIADYNMAWRDYSGDIQSVHLMGVIAVFILLIACINFMNLATARSIRRAREVGLRKVVGAHRFQVVGQFLGEAVLMSILAMIIALGLAKLAMPYFVTLSGKVHLSLVMLWEPQVLIGMVGMVCVVGLLAGSYPAFFISAFEPVETVKGSFKTGSRGAWIREHLVVMQFALSILLIIGTFVVFQQMEYIRNQTLGYDKDPIILTNIFSVEKSLNKNRKTRLVNRYQVVKQEMLKHRNIVKVSAFSRPLGRKMHGQLQVFVAEGHAGENLQMQILNVDDEFLSLFGIEVIAGRNFSLDMPTDQTFAYLLNETAVKQLGWDDPIGKSFGLTDGEGKVIGVVKDFHFSSLHTRIGSLALRMNTSSYGSLGIQVRAENIEETVAFIEKVWKQFMVSYEPPRYQFMEEWFDRNYQDEKRVSKMATIFAGLAIFLACLGLLGLVSYAVEQRTKEIGVRKVLGASVGGVMVLLSKDFVKFVLIANVIAWPVAYFSTVRWLQGFAYHIDIGVLPFVLASMLALTIALGTVSFHAWKAARANPVDAIKYE